MTADLILDASATLAWCFEDERSADSDALLDRLATSAALVPGLWHVELAHALLALARAHRLTVYDATYLDLALRRNLPLATRDPALGRAAAAAGAALLPA